MPHLANSINYSFQHSTSPQELKKVIPLYKKLDPLQKENYRLLSFLPYISKVFERTIHNEITGYMPDKQAMCIAAFRKSHGTQHSLINMPEK